MMITAKPFCSFTEYKNKHKLGIGDEVKLWDGQVYEVIDFFTDGCHHEFCLGDRRTMKAGWGYFLGNCRPREDE